MSWSLRERKHIICSWKYQHQRTLMLFKLHQNHLQLFQPFFSTTLYLHQVDNADFHVEKTVAAAPASTDGTEVALEVTFEPSRLGEQRATLIVSSPIGGEYTFPLVGTCTPPKPQGPYIIKAGATSAINFRNVFSNTTTFLFQVGLMDVKSLSFFRKRMHSAKLDENLQNLEI